MQTTDPSPCSRKKKNSSLVQSSLSFQPIKKLKTEGKSLTSPPKMSHYAGVTRGSSFGVKTETKATKKKLVIKNFAPPVVSEQEKHLMWDRLQRSVNAIHHTQPINISLEDLYKDVENLCLNGSSQNLYDSLNVEVENYVKSCLAKFSDCEDMLDKTVFLKKLSQLWSNHCKQTVMIRNIFLHLERNFAQKNPMVLSLWDMSAKLFREIIMGELSLSEKCINGLLAIIGSERQGDAVDRSLLKSVLGMLCSLNMYQSHFEIPFLQQSQHHYSSEGQQQSQKSNVPVYLAYVEGRLAEEEDRLLHYLDPGTRKQLISVVEYELISRHIKLLLEKGFDTMMDEKRFNDTTLLYKLLSCVKEGTEQLCEFLEVYIKKRGLELVMNPEKDKTMVQDLLEFKDSIDYVIENSFKNSLCFQDVKKKAFEAFINKRLNKPAELIAKYIDLKLRSGNKEQSEEELEKMLDKVMVIFRFIQGKDVFEAFYKKDLAKRLLMSKSASIDSEKSMLSKLKQECGSQFTWKLEGMFKDIDISKDLMTGYKNTKTTHGVDLSVNILTTGYWPTYQPATVVVPGNLTKILDNFKTFYLGKHSGRKLVWQHSLSFCSLKAFFGDPNDNSFEAKTSMKKEISVSFYQALVLLMFNNSDKLSYQEILDSTQIEESDLGRVLQSLACGKVRVIKKKPVGKDIEKTDEFEFNKEFRHKMCKLKINQIQMKETQDENQITTEKVYQDRQYQIDAAVVRIMKTRKTLLHSLLVSELYNQLKFPVKPIDLKKRIENLIERDYMERDKEKNNLYHYVA